jgi:hypothetical protein
MLSDIAIYQNKGNDNAQGVLFGTVRNAEGKETDEAFAISKPVIARVSEFGRFDYDRNAPFYHYFEEGFMRNQTKVGLNEIHNILDGYKFVHQIRLPYGNLINFLFQNFPEDPQRSRVRCIIKSKKEQCPKDMLVCRFDEDGIFKHPAVAKPFVIDKYSKISKQYISTEKMYLCQIINQNQDFYFVNVKGIYFQGIEIGLYEVVGGGFFPETQDEVYNFDNYDDKRVMRIPFMIDSNYNFEPISINAELIMRCLRMLNGFEWVDLFMGETIFCPVLLTGIRPNDDFPLVQCFIAPLDPRSRGDAK